MLLRLLKALANDDPTDLPLADKTLTFESQVEEISGFVIYSFFENGSQKVRWFRGYPEYFHAWDRCYGLNLAS